MAQKWWFPSHPIHRHHVLDAMQRQDLIASVLQELTIVNTASLNIVKTAKVVFELSVLEFLVIVLHYHTVQT